MKPKKHQRLGDESEESQHLAQNPGGDEAVGELSIEAASPGRQTPSTPRHERKRCCGKRCKVGCAAIWLLIGWWLVSLLIQYPNSDFWAKEIMQSETVETILYILSPANRRTYDAIKAYYDSQRPLILESARHFEANKAWVADMHLDGYKQYYYYDVVSLRTFMMERRWLADPRNDDFLWEKDKCVMYSWFRRNGFPFTEILREWHDIRGTAEQAVDLVSTDMRNRSGHSQYALGSSPVTYPSFLKCCHITQGHLKSTHIVHNEAALEAASGEGLREWMVSHWDQRPNDYGRAWTEPHDRLVATIPPGFLLQAAWPFDAEFKIYIAWGRAYWGYSIVWCDNGRHLHIFRDNTTREYTLALDSVHAAEIGRPNEHWLFTEGHMERIWRLAEGIALVSGIEMIRIDFFLNRMSGELRINENSLSSGCSPVFRSECKFFSWAWAEPLVTRDFQTYQTPLRTYELSIFDTVHPPPNLARAMPKLAGWVRSGPDTSGSTWRTSRWA